MKPFVPYEKLSKRQQREISLKARNKWSISPVTRRQDNPKAYNRAKTRQSDRKGLLTVYFLPYLTFFIGSRVIPRCFSRNPINNSNIIALFYTFFMLFDYCLIYLFWSVFGHKMKRSP